jgi:hypothetical protein
MHPQTTSDVGRDGEEPWDMMTSDAGWAETLQGLDVFGFFYGHFDAADKVFAQPVLEGAGVRVNVEVGGLRAFQCDGATFFETIDAPVFDQIVAGGHTDFVASLDAPFTYTVLDGFHSQCGQAAASGVGDPVAEFGCDPLTLTSCDLTPEQVSDELVEYLALFRARYPEASIGWIEPLPFFEFGTFPSETSIIEGTPYPDFGVVSDTLEARVAAYDESYGTDIGFDFFHVDMYYTGMLVPIMQETYDPWAKNLAIADHVRANGMRFGILLNDYREWLPTTEEKDQNFHDGVVHYFDCWHAFGGSLDDVVVESWVIGFPSAVIPEDQPYTFAQVMLELMGRMADSDYTPVCDLEADIDVLLSQL